MRYIALEECSKLLDLELRGIEIVQPQSLAKLTAIRSLDLRYAEGIETAQFAAGMRDLIHIDLDGTGVSDISPLGDLPRLASITANGTKVSSLPRKPFPALRALEVMSALVSADEVKAFSSSHPSCKVRHTWKAALKDALSGVDRLRIRSGGTCHRDAASEKTLAEVKDSREIGDFVDGIEIDESKANFHCRCCGEPSFEFYRGESLVVTVGFHHGESLRWPDGWIGDARLRPKSATFIVDWLAKRQVKGPLSAREEAAERVRKEQEFLSFFPSNARRTMDKAEPGNPGEPWEKAAHAVWSDVAREMADPVKSVVAACRALGTVQESWSGRTFAQQVVLACAEEMDGGTFLAALKALGDDRSALLGASRLAFFEDVLDQVPEKDRTEIAVKLAEVTVTDANDDNKLRPIRRLSDDRDPRSTALLLKIAAGKAGREVAKGSGFDEPGIRTAAYLALARQEKKEIAVEIQKHLANGDFERPEDRAALEICLALLGDPQFIKAEHFKFFSGTIGHASLAAIERFGGREGMDVLFEAAMGQGFASVREESVLAAERLTGEQWFLRRPNERAEWHIKEARAWWKANRERFLREH